MSTYFYLACRTCRRFVPLASTHGGRASGLSGDEWLRAFAVAHGDDHALFSASEHDECLSSFVEVDAESANNDERSRFYEQNYPTWYVDAGESERRIKAKQQELVLQYARDHGLRTLMINYDSWRYEVCVPPDGERLPTFIQDAIDLLRGENTQSSAAQSEDMPPTCELCDKLRCGCKPTRRTP